MVEILDIEGYTFDKEVLRLALDEYESFKGSKEYDEDYKWKTFEELNSWFEENEITEDNIVEFVEFIQEQNQGSGYFVHWSELDDLREHAEENPEKLTELFDDLYHGNEDLQDRLAKFREKTGIGTPGLGYVLAAYDYEEYAPIKVDQFRDFIYHFADEVPTKIGSFSVSEKYAFYHGYCHKMLDFLEEEGIVKEGTHLDAQDFYYTIESYDEVNKEKIFLEYIWQFCQRFDEFEKNSELLIEEISSLPADFLKSERGYYEDSEKVNKIRYLALDELLEEGNVDIDTIKTQVDSEYDKDILQAWTNFTIYSQIYWDYFRDRLKEYFESISEFLTNNIGTDGIESHIVTFQGARGRPTVEPWLLIYPEEKGDHRDSYQFFFRILPEKIEYGLSHGENIEDSEFEEKYVGQITEIDENSLGKVLETYNDVLDEFIELNDIGLDTDEDIKWYIEKYKEDHDYETSLEERHEFERKYKEIFDPANIDELDKEDLFSFLKESFWPGLQRSKNKITEDMDKLRKSIEYLLDEDEDIKERLNNVVDNSDSEYWIKGMGKNLASAIISLMNESDEYGIFNERAVGAMKKLGIYPDEIDTTMSTGEKYVKLNEVLNKLNEMALEDMWDVDYFVYWLDENYEDLVEEKRLSRGLDEAGRTEEEGTNYFWITANPDIWWVSEIKDGGEIFYTAYNKKGNKRRVFEAFKNAGPRDKVLFYQSTPVKKIVAEGEIVEGLHREEEEGYNDPVEGISIKYSQPINGISWEDITAVPELEDSDPVCNRAQGSIFELTKDEYETTLALEPEEPVTEKTKEEILLEKNRASLEFEGLDFTENLHFPEEMADEINQSIRSALRAGKNIIFTGPPGTGKTKIARNVAKEIEEDCDCVDGFTFTTATADWTTFDTIGGYQPSKEDGSLSFKSGQFLKCFREDDGTPVNKWLIIDEINRADIDKAFGQLFSVLSNDDVELPFTNDEEESIWVKSLSEEKEDINYSDSDYYVTRNWRLLATMNTYDKASLYEMSYAFMRRFAFIDVGVPTEDIDEELITDYIEKWGGIDEDEVTGYLENMKEIWEVLNESKRSIGPAIIRDMLLFLQENESDDAVVEALKLYVLPQLEGMIKQDQKDIFDSLIGIEGLDESRVKRVAKQRFEISKEKLGEESE